MASKRRTKKTIKAVPQGQLWLRHIKFWLYDGVEIKNQYRELSRSMADYGIAELSGLVGISKERLKRHIIFNVL